MSTEASGRRLLLSLAGVVVVLAGAVGFVVGANGAERGASVTVFGVLAVPTTPLSLATVGVVVAALAMGLLFGAVVFASRFDGAGRDDDSDRG